jgi:deazaflavin-dependent oxidoreductase (nitroreductase family)
MNDWNTKIIEEFRANKGKVGGQFEGVPLALLHTTGAKTGQDRVHPLAYLDFDGRRFVFASKGGADTNPIWYVNLLANPQVRVEVGGETYQATAKPLTGEERDRIFKEQASRMPGFAEYQAKTTRIIPAVELIPAA